jgi:glycerophosphoryl diester phosphodiesterase
VEVDVRRTLDGALVVHHDPAPPGGPVLRTVDLAEVRRQLPAIPTLDEALDECAGLLVNVEIKNLPWEPDFDPNEAVADAVVELLAARGGSDHVLVSSFHLPTIDHVRTIAPEVPTAFLCIAGIDLRAMADLAADHGHVAVHPDVRALEGPTAAELVGHALTRGLAVNVWTVNEPADAVRLTRLGVTGLITDVPEVMIAALDQTGSTSDNASGT